MAFDRFAIGTVAGSPCTCGSSSTCTLCVGITYCNGTPVSGETVTVTGPAGGTCTTGSGGSCCIDITSGGSGSYTISWGKTGFIGGSTTVNVTCPGTTNVNVTDSPTGTGYTVTVYGCNGLPLPGAAVSAGCVSGTTNSSGQVTFPLCTPGTYTWSVSAPRFVPQSGTFTINAGCIGSGLPNIVNLLPATGYTCAGSNYNCAYPIATTLYATCAVGSITLLYCPIAGNSIWQGLGTCTGGPCKNCNAAPTGSCTVSWSGQWAFGAGLGFTAAWVINQTDPTKFGDGATITGSGCTAAWTCGFGCCSNTLGVTNSGSYTCPIPFTASGSFSGLTGLGANWNGPWAITE